MMLYLSSTTRIFVLLALFVFPLSSLAQCPNCCNAVMDCSETGVDCGGPDCMPCNSIVPNGSFECITAPGCFLVSGPGQITWAPNWTYADASEASSIYNSCFLSDANLQPPAVYHGNQNPRTGSGMAGFLVQNDQFSDWRAGYVQIPLSTPLTAGNFYDMEFYVSRADNYGWAIGGIGAYFSVGAVTPGDYSPLNIHGYSPHFEYNPLTHITDAVGWTQITGTYTASGGEDHVIIGNFRITQPNGPLATYVCCGNGLGFYFIDDVTLIQNGGLPVNFSSFTAEEHGGKVRLEWTTETEQNSSHFIIERQANGGVYEAIGEHPAAGNSTDPINYSWVDETPPSGTIYYRLKEVDLDGKFQYTSIETVELGTIAFQDAIYYNQDYGALNYEITFGKNDLTSELNIELIDQMGHVHLSDNLEVRDSRINGSLQTGKLPRGIYFVRFSTAHHSVTRKFVVLR